MSARAAVALAAALAAVGLSACGGGGSTSTVQPNPPAGAPPANTSTGKQPSVKAPETPTTSTSTSPEQKPGGAGDETPAHFNASLTGRGGRITPSSVHVGPYISVRVQLRSADGALYQLRVNGKTLAAQGSKSSSLTLPGLRPGRSYVLAQPAGGPSVKIVANAEPGP